MDTHKMYELGYYNHYFDFNYKGDKYIAQAEFGPDEKIVSVILGNLNEYDQWEACDYSKELFEKDLGLDCVNKITNDWKKDFNIYTSSGE